MFILSSAIMPFISDMCLKSSWIQPVIEAQEKVIGKNSSDGNN